MGFDFVDRQHRRKEIRLECYFYDPKHPDGPCQGTTNVTMFTPPPVWSAANGDVDKIPLCAVCRQTRGWLPLQQSG